MMRSGKPAPALQRYVRYYAQITDHIPAQAHVQPIPARTAIVLDFTLGDRYEAEMRVDERLWREIVHPIALIGVQSYRRVHLAMRGRVDEFVILFQPGGLSGLFPVPPDELLNQHFDGRAVLGRPAEELRCRLGEAQSFAERIRVADTFLLARASHGPQSGVVAAAGKLHQHRGCLPISGLAELAGLSLRQFERRFLSEVGMSPKLYARVARFEAALAIKMRAPGLRWTDVAQDLGYHDQMHMVHDFRQLSGATPSDIAPHMDDFVTAEISATR
jgi:AraC-like DNA-binding protein